MKKNEDREITDEDIEAFKEQIRSSLDVHELNITTSKLVVARYMVNGFAHWDEKASVPYFRNVVLYLYDVKSKKELISAHHENYAKRDEIFLKLIPIFAKSIEYRLCIRRY